MPGLFGRRMSATDSQWLLYIIQAQNRHLYTGITNNLNRRLQQHCQGSGARFFRTSPPETLLYTEPQEDRAAASRREAVIKKLTRAKKIDLIAQSGQSPKAIRDLLDDA